MKKLKSLPSPRSPLPSCRPHARRRCGRRTPAAIITRRRHGGGPQRFNQSLELGAYSSPRAIACSSRATNSRSMRSSSSRGQVPMRASLSCAGSLMLSVLRKSGISLFSAPKARQHRRGSRLISGGPSVPRGGIARCYKGGNPLYHLGLSQQGRMTLIRHDDDFKLAAPCQHLIQGGPSQHI
jgi:hypothetical protein